MCVDQCFLIVLKKLLDLKDVEVIHGRVQLVYLDRDMIPVPENPDQALTEYSGTTPGFSEIDKTEKGRTYVLDEGEKNNDTDKDGTNKADTSGDAGKGDEEGGAGVEFDENELDGEVEAVTGKPDMDHQKPLADDMGSAGTLTPDI